MKQVLKRSLSALLALVLLFGVIPVGIGNLAAAWTPASEYPYKVNAGVYQLDDYSFYKSECVSFVAWCMNVRNGIQFSNYKVDGRSVYNNIWKEPDSGGMGNGNGTRLSHAKYWGTALQSMGYTVDSNPTVGSIAWTDSGTYGHVAWVTAVNGDGTVSIEEYNNGWVVINGEYHGNHQFNSRTVTKGSFRYIHVKDIPTHTCDYKASATVTKAPTRTATGTRVRTCSCGKTYTQTIPAIPYTTDLAEGIYTITTKCKAGLQVATNASSNYNVFISDGNYEDQYWLFRKNSDGTYTIENAIHNGKVLDVEGGSMVNDANIFAFDYHGGDNQKFYVVPVGSYYKLVAKSSYLNFDNYCGGTTSENNIIQYEDNGNDAQRWTLTRSNPPLNLSATSVTVNEGSSKTVNCTIGRATYGSVLSPSISSSSVCSTSWGKWDGWTCPLTITGKSGGTATVTVTFKDKDTDIVFDTKTITVTVPYTNYTVSFNANGGSVSPTSKSVSKGSTYGTLPTPTRTGYSFAGWYTAASGGTQITSGTTVSLTANQTLYAHWTQNTYTATIHHWCDGFNGKGTNTWHDSNAICLTVTTKDFNYSSGITFSQNDCIASTALPNGVKAAFTFGESNFSGTWQAHSLPKTFNNVSISGEVEYYYHLINYNITYDLDGGTLAEPNPDTYNVVYGASFANEPTKEGCYFRGWTIDGTTTVTGVNTASLPDSAFVNDAGLEGGAFYEAVKNRTTGDLTVKAKWANYKIDYDGNGGWIMKKTEYDPTTITTANFTRKNYTFVGWALTPDATADDVIYQPGDPYESDEDLTLYAVWEPDGFWVTFNAGEGYFYQQPDYRDNLPPEYIKEECFPNELSQMKMTDQPLTLGSMIPRRLGYRFVKWKNESYADQMWAIFFSNGGKRQEYYYPGDVYDVNYRMHLYPVWEEVGVCSYRVEICQRNAAGEYFAMRSATFQASIGDPVSFFDTPLATGIPYSFDLEQSTLTGSAADGLVLRAVFDNSVPLKNGAQLLPTQGGRLVAGVTGGLAYRSFASTLLDLSKSFATGCRFVGQGNLDRRLGTGAQFELYSLATGTALDEPYTIVVFGDVDGDGWYDGTDAYLVNLVANGMVEQSALTEAQRAAADCNHDGTVDNADVALLEQAGLLLANVDQTLPSEELQTDSVYLEYCSLIDQTVEIIEPEQPAAEQTNAEQPAQTAEQPAAQSVWGWIKALFTIVLNWLLRVF